MILTKQTIIVWDNPSQWLIESLQGKREAKIAEMAARNLTDGIYIEPDERTAHRYWTDEAAAQEYIDFIRILAAEENQIVISATIVDSNL